MSGSVPIRVLLTFKERPYSVDLRWIFNWESPSFVLAPTYVFAPGYFDPYLEKYLPT